MNDALGLLEIDSIARGFLCADAAVKRAPIELVFCGPVTPGKYLLLAAGGVAELGEALDDAARVADRALVDRLFLPLAHPQLLPAVRAGAGGLPGAPARHAGRSVGVLELHTVAAGLRAADAACKAADVELQLFHWARGIGGKAYFLLRGELSAVEAALAAGTQVAGEGLLAGAELIAAPHGDLVGRAL